MRQTLIVLLLIAALTACASKDHVLFVTKTSVGIDFDSKPPAASLAYDRVEGYIAPRYGNGGIPEVVASVKSDGQIFSPKMKQVYATGDAAIIATSGQNNDQQQGTDSEQDSAGENAASEKGDREMMFFGTTTTTGVKVSFTTGLPDSFVFGFKRKEFSYIPLAVVKQENHPDRYVYPSVLASIDTNADVAADGTVTNTELTNAQFFATGDAARNLAGDASIKDAFTGIAKESVMQLQHARVQVAQTQADLIDMLLDDIEMRFSDTAVSQTKKEEIVAAAKDAGTDLNSDMTVDNFEKRLRKFASITRQHDKVLERLTKLRGRVVELLR